MAPVQDDNEWAGAEMEGEEWECVVCDKSFRSEAAWNSHERSRKHLKQVERSVSFQEAFHHVFLLYLSRLRAEMQEEEEGSSEGELVVDREQAVTLPPQSEPEEAEESAALDGIGVVDNLSHIPARVEPRVEYSDEEIQDTSLDPNPSARIHSKSDARKARKSLHFVRSGLTN